MKFYYRLSGILYNPINPKSGSVKGTKQIMRFKYDVSKLFDHRTLILLILIMQ